MQSVIVVLIVLLALAIRLNGLRFGFPYLFHPDEPTSVNRALAFSRTGLNPHWFGMPSLYLYLLHFSYLLLCKMGFLFGLARLLPYLQPDKIPFYFIGRLWSAIFGTGTVVMVYLTGKTLFSRPAAAAASFLVAVLPLHLLHSHFATVDVPVTFFIILSFFFSSRLLGKKALKYYILAGAAAGLAAATKYNGSFIILPLLAVHFLREKEGSRRKGVLYLCSGLATSAVLFFLATPYSILELNQFLKDLSTQSNYLVNTGHGPIFISTGPGFLYHLTYTMYYAGGAVFWVLASAGIIYALVRRQKSDWLILSWVVPYFILISIPTVKFSRFFIPLLPFLALWAGRLMEIPFRNRYCSRIFCGLWCCGFLWLFIQALAFCGVLSRPDPRIEAKKWLEENLPKPSRIGLIKTETGLIFLDDPPLSRNLSGLPVEQYKRLLPALEGKPQYIIATDYDYRQILRLKDEYDQERCDRWNDFLSGKLGYRLIREFNSEPHFLFFHFGGSFPPHDMIYNRPRISVFRRE